MVGRLARAPLERVFGGYSNKPFHDVEGGGGVFNGCVDGYILDTEEVEVNGSVWIWNFGAPPEEEEVVKRRRPREL